MATSQVVRRGWCSSLGKDASALGTVTVQPTSFERLLGGEELRQAVDGTLEAMWTDGSLNKIKRVYLDPLEIEPSEHP